MSTAVGRTLYRAFLRAGQRFDALEAANGRASMVDLAEGSLKANAFSEWRDRYPEEWNWKTYVSHHEKLQSAVDKFGANPLSIQPVIR